MVKSWRLTRAIAVLAVPLACGCGPKRVAEPTAPVRTLIVLLEDPDGGPSSGATVSTASGKVQLSSARDATRVVAGGPPSPVAPMDEAELRKVFGSTLSDLPLPPQRFNLYFRLESDELTEESRGVLPDVLRAVADRPAPDVTVIGHTDTTGDPASNYRLGLKRANMVRALLLKTGLDPSLVAIASHGEADPLIPTGNDTAEPRNRRVEITVK